jgi:spore maturation protein CgeB
MRTLVVGPQFSDSFTRNISVTLGRMGHEVINVEGTRFRHHGRRLPNLWWTYVPKAFPALEKRIFGEVVRAAAAVQPDLVLVTYGIMPPEVVEDVRKACKGKVVCWFIDPVTSLYRCYLLASQFDAVFLNEPFLVRVLRGKLGLKAFYLPECCNPLWHKRVSLTGEDRRKYECDLTAQGTLHYYRARMLEVFADYDLKIWGRNCPSWIASRSTSHCTHHYIAERDKAKALGAAKIVVNIMYYSGIEAVNCTLFEAAGCGAFQIADWRPCLPDLFEPEREIVTFHTREELKEKVDYYLTRPEKCSEIADRAYTRAHREHTYEVRLKKMFEVLGLSSEAVPIPESTALPVTVD